MISDTRIECRNGSSQRETAGFGPTWLELGSLSGKHGSVALDFYHRCRNVARTCRHFGITVRRSIVGAPLRSVRPDPSATLQSRPSPPAPAHLVFSRRGKGFAVALQFPRWGKDKLAVLLGRQQVSAPMVGRILTRLSGRTRL
jgi:hypothetical protein